MQMRIAALDGVRTDSLLADSTRDDAAAARRHARTDARRAGRSPASTARPTATRSSRPRRSRRARSRGPSPATQPSCRSRWSRTSRPTSACASAAASRGTSAGVEVESRVTSLRKVDWAQVQPNFFAVFPAGPLDAAPQTAVAADARGHARGVGARSRAPSSRRSPTCRPSTSASCSSCSTACSAASRSVLRFMALFAVVTGLVVLAGAVRVALGQRTREAVLLRTMGASRAQVRRTLVAEYALLGRHRSAHRRRCSPSAGRGRWRASPSRSRSCWTRRGSSRPSCSCPL